MRILGFLATAAAAFLLHATPAAAQAWPAKPVRLVVPFPAGGTTDILARIIGQRLGDKLGQQFVIDNRGGAGGNVGAEVVAKADPDGYTILMTTIGIQSINAHLYSKMSFDPLKDLAPVSLVAMVANVLVVHPSVPAKTIPEFIALAKAQPGKLNFGTPGNGSSGHLSTELFKTMTGTNMVHVPYRGSAPMLTDLLAGQVQFAIDNLPSALPHIKSGALRALAVTTPQRWPATPELATIAEQGVPGYNATAWFGVVAPSKVAPDIIKKLSAEIDAIIKAPDVKAQFAQQGAEGVGGSPESFAKFIAEENDKWAKVVKASGAKVD